MYRLCYNKAEGMNMLPMESMTVLQLSGAVEPKAIERAYRASVARYERLTQRGPLQFYRRELLADAEKAFESLRRGGCDHPRIETPSLLRRRAEQMGLPVANGHPPVRASERIGPILAGQAEKIRSRSVQFLRDTPAEAAKSERDQAIIEDHFCREVIYRLEGDLIRYTSRCELLKIAADWEIPLFHANMLIAQIVEAVRHNKLYDIGRREKEFWLPPRPQNDKRRRIILLATALLTVAVAAESWLLYRWFG
jgi:hypothetical protein